MDVLNIEIGDYFITSALPLDRSFRYGILCASKDDQKVVFKRLTNGELFSLFIKDGQIDIGQWVKTNLNGFENVNELINIMDSRQEVAEEIQCQIESNMNDKWHYENKTTEILKSALSRAFGTLPEIKHNN